MYAGTQRDIYIIGNPIRLEAEADVICYLLFIDHLSI